MKLQNPSSRHHFIPEFLLRPWAVNNGELIRYFRDFRKELRTKPAAPKSLGFRWDLYTTTGLPPEHEQQVETLFMQRVDDDGARAHRLLLEGGVLALSEVQWVHWARFVMALWFRTPTDVEYLDRAVTTLTDAAATRPILDIERPESLPPAAVKQLQMEAMMRAIDDADRGRTLINMQWDVLEIGADRQFWISDWPLCVPANAPWLGDTESYITVPIAPTKLFVAAGSAGKLAAIGALSPRQLEQRQNRATVSHATDFVGATDERNGDFIRRNFGTVERPSITREIASRYAAQSRSDGASVEPGL